MTIRKHELGFAKNLLLKSTLASLALLPITDFVHAAEKKPTLKGVNSQVSNLRKQVGALRSELGTANSNLAASNNGLSAVTSALATKANSQDLVNGLASKAAQTEIGRLEGLIAGKANSQDLTSGLAGKASNAALGTKADQAEISRVEGLINGKASIASVNLKADQSVVNTALGLKADQAAVNTALGLKAEQTVVNTALSLKAEQSAVTASLGLKADLTSVTAITERLDGLTVIAENTAATGNICQLVDLREQCNSELGCKIRFNVFNGGNVRNEVKHVIYTAASSFFGARKMTNESSFREEANLVMGSASIARVVAFFGPVNFAGNVVTLKNTGDNSGVTGQIAAGACPANYEPMVPFRDVTTGEITRGADGQVIMVPPPMGPSATRGYRDPFLVTLTVPPMTKVVMSVTGE